MFENKIKTCSKCKENKPIEEFSFRKNGYYQSHCKLCQCKYGKIHYNENKIKYKERNKCYEESIRRQVDLLKSKPCSDCKQTFPPICMDFDHINDDKLDNVSSIISSHSMKKILEEIKKCEVVCACCHRLRTQKRRELSNSVERDTGFEPVSTASDR